jgi:hypothetical protein
MKKLILISTAFILSSSVAFPQGCVPARNLVGFGQFAIPEYGQEDLKWLVNVNNRYFKSYLDYRGSDDLKTPEVDQRLNHIYTFNFSVTRLMKNGWSLMVDIPITAANRTTWQEHGNNGAHKVRKTVSAFGLSDIRVMAYKWLLNVEEQHRGNIQIGLGLKLPTGDYDSKAFFHRIKKDGTDSVSVMAPVNPSIQLGDGGTGIATELNGYFTVNSKINLYGNFFYLLSPRDVNGVSNMTGFNPSPVQVADGSYINSVPDVYALRAGANFTFGKFIGGLGGRMEGSPTYDLIGESNGGRRAGKTISLEPGINYKVKNSILYLFVPIPVYRATQQTVPDKIATKITGIETFRPGGFTNYMIFVGAVFKL